MLVAALGALLEDRVFGYAALLVMGAFGLAGGVVSGSWLAGPLGQRGGHGGPSR